jgi:tRNA(fMet)-specific endonuclease VapC
VRARVTASPRPRLPRHYRGATAYTATIHGIGAPQLAISVVSLAEQYEGIFHSATPEADEQTLLSLLSDKTLLPITDDVCRLFGEQRARLRRLNQLSGDLDLLIAVTCLAHDLALLTPNRRHFERIPGLRIGSTPLP